MEKLTIILLTILSLFSSCYKPVDEDSDSFDAEQASANSTAATTDETCELTVRLSLANADAAATLSPIHLFAFDADGNAVVHRVVTDVTSAEKIMFARGRYHLTAICGADDEPLDRVTAASDIIMRNDGPSATEPLLMGMADVTLAADQATTTLCLTRQTAEIELLPITLDTHAQSATVTLSRLYSGIDLNATMHDAQAVSVPLALTDGRWSAATCHLLPSEGSALTVSLEVVADDAAPQTYGYVLQERLMAGGRYQIAPSDNAEIAFDGTEPSAEETTDDDGFTLDQWPCAPCLWDGHVVALVDSLSPTEADLLLLSCNEWDGVHSAFYETDATEAATIAAQYVEGGTDIGPLDDWHIPTKEEATALRNCYAPDSAAVLNAFLADAGYVTVSLKKKSDNVRYLCNDAQHTFTFASATASLTKAGTKATYNLRLVKTVRVRVIER